MKRTLKPIFPPAGIEKEYEKRLKKAVREMEHSVVYWLRAKYRANESKIVGDSATDDLLKAFRKLLHQWERNFRELADVLPRWFVNKIRGYVAGNLAQQTKPLKDAGLGFNLKFSYMSQRERQTFQAIVKENVNLIKSIARESLTQVEGIVLRNIEAGHDLARMTDELHKQFGVTERRARMIARDQTNKATNNLSRQRLLSYGINKGIWMHTASGKTYRETHALDHTQGGMDGAEYFIDEGCYDPNPNVQDYIQPGELVNCYCVCRPVIPQLSEEETEAGIEEIFNELGEPLPETPKEAETIKEQEQQEIGFVPANTIQEANSYITDKYGIQANYKGVELAVANEWNAGLTNAFEQFPELKQNFDFVGEAHNRSAILKEKVKAHIEDFLEKMYGGRPSNFDDMVKRQLSLSMGKYRVSSSAMALSYTGGESGLNGVCVNRAGSANTAKNMLKSLKMAVADGFHPVGCDTIRSVLDHEIGHQIDHLLDLRASRDFLAYYNSLSPDDIKKGLSGYATKNSAEFIAEAWTEYLNNPKPRPIAKTIGEMIEKAYKRKYKGAKA